MGDNLKFVIRSTYHTPSNTRSIITYYYNDKLANVDTFHHIPHILQSKEKTRSSVTIQQQGLTFLYPPRNTHTHARTRENRLTTHARKIYITLKKKKFAYIRWSDRSFHCCMNRECFGFELCGWPGTSGNILVI